MSNTYDEALKYVVEQLNKFFEHDPEKALYWLMTPNRGLGDIVPAWLMLAHPKGPEKLVSFIRNSVEENYP